LGKFLTNSYAAHPFFIYKPVFTDLDSIKTPEGKINFIIDNKPAQFDLR